MDLSDQFLVESRSAREQGLTKLKAQQSEQRILNKVKSLFFAVWQGIGRVTPEKLAEFYEVTLDSISQNYARCRDEFDSDGVKVFRGQELKDASDILSLPSRTSQKTIYTPAGALRMGFILRDSEVAKQVRTVAIRFIQGVGDQIENRAIFQSLTASHPYLAPMVQGNTFKISAPYALYWDKMKSTLKKQYSTGGIPGMSSEDIRKSIQFCASYTDDMKLQGIKELKREIAGEIRGQYPSLISDIFYVDIENQSGSIVLMFQFQDLIVDMEYVQECVGRGYIQTAQEDLGVDRAYLIFVAPFGATSYAQDYIRRLLPSDYRGCVGVLKVKELADVLYKQAYDARGLGTKRGEIKSEFAKLLTYSLPDPPAIYDQLKIEGVE